jgi:hypothetical protein
VTLAEPLVIPAHSVEQQRGNELMIESVQGKVDVELRKEPETEDERR